ncbi:MAG TPA: trigger factor [Flavobacteriales bacterium]|nr:trigger factor [Flavobacteriales bacterium]
MHIEKEETGTLTATLKVKLAPEDYTPGVEQALKEQRRSATLPGFRPGQVPLSIIRKRVGKAVLVNEVERLVGETLNDYIRTNSLKVLGQPLPTNDSIEGNDWDSPGEFTFAYEVGMAPAFEVELDKKLGVDRVLVEVDDALLDKEIADMTRRFGKLEDAEVSEEKDMLLGDMIELDAEGNIKEGGIMNRATISLEFLEDEHTRSSLTGLRSGDEVQVDPHKVSSGHDDLARMLGITHEQVHHLESSFLFRVAEVKRMVPMEVGQELFDRVFGQGAVEDETAFRAKVKEGMEASFERDSDRLYLRDVLRKLEEKHQVELPDGFLKRWIQETSENPVTPEEVEQGYGEYAEGLRRQLLQDGIIEKYGLEAKGEELDAFAKRYVADQFAQYGMPAPEEGEIQRMAGRILSDRDQLGRIRNTIVERKLMTHFKAMLEPKERRIPLDEFVNLARS